jgi:hypothetical protein
MRFIGPRFLAVWLTGVLSAVWWGVAILLVLSVCLLVISPWVDPPRINIGLALPVHLTLDPVTHAVTAPSAEDVYLKDVTASLYFSPRSPAVVAVSASALAATLALALWVVGQLRAVVRTVRDGRPFVPANARRLRRIAYAVFVAEVAKALAVFAGSRYILGHFAGANFQFRTRVDFDVMSILLGLVILVIAEVFREGTRLEQEQALTI